MIKLNLRSKSCLQNTLTTAHTFLLAVFIFFGILIFTSLVIFIFIPIKVLVFVFAKIFRPDLLSFVPSKKAMLGSPKTHKNQNLNICPVFIYDGPIDVKELQQLFQHRVMAKLKPNRELMYPELKMFWTNFLVYSFWKEDKNFDLSNHVRLYDYGQKSTKEEQELKLPDPEEGFCTEEDLSRVLGPLLVKPWKMHRSPWELLVVQNFKYDYHRKQEQEQDAESWKSCTVLIFRIHHAMCDGYSVLKLIRRDLMQTPLSINLNFKQWKLWQKLLFYCILPFKFPWDLACKLNTPGPGNERNSRPLSRKVFVSTFKPIETQLVKDVKNKYSVGYNSVLTAVVAGAMKRTMEEAGQNVSKEVKCFMPLPLPGHPDGLAVHATGIIFQLTMDKKLKREERLLHTHKELSLSKFNSVSFASLLINRLGNFLPNIYFLFRHLSSHTLAISNMSIPMDQPPFVGLGVNAIDCISCVGPGSGKTGTLVCLMSFSGRQRFSLVIDRALVPSKEVLEKFGDFVEQELLALLDSDSKSQKMVDRKV